MTIERSAWAVTSVVSPSLSFADAGSVNKPVYDGKVFPMIRCPGSSLPEWNIINQAQYQAYEPTYTAILGSARTLYQASKDGWIFGFMQRTSIRGVPLRAMGFDVVFNLILMLIGNPIYIIAASTVGYMVFNVLNITTGYLLRKDAPLAERPYTAPLIMISEMANQTTSGISATAVMRCAQK